MPLGVPELLIILVIIIVIFGVGRLPEIGGAIGRSIKEFKTSVRDDEDQQSLNDSSTDAKA